MLSRPKNHRSLLGRNRLAAIERLEIRTLMAVDLADARLAKTGHRRPTKCI